MYYKKNLTSIIMPTCHKLLKTNELCFEKSIKQNYQSIEFLILISGMNRREYEKIVKQQQKVIDKLSNQIINYQKIINKQNIQIQKLKK